MRIPWVILIAVLAYCEASSAVITFMISWKDGNQIGWIGLDHQAGVLTFDVPGIKVVPGMTQLRSAIEGFCYFKGGFQEVTEYGRVIALRLPVTPGYYGTWECGYYFTEENVILRGYEATRNSFSYRDVGGVVYCHIDKADSVKVVGCQHPFFANYGYSDLDLRFCNPSAWTSYEKGADKAANCPVWYNDPIEIETFFDRVGHGVLPTQTDEKFILALGDFSLYLLPNDAAGPYQNMYHGRVACEGEEQWGFKKPAGVTVKMKYVVNGLNAVSFNELQGCADPNGNLLSGWRQKCSLTLAPVAVEFQPPSSADPPFISVCSNGNPGGYIQQQGVSVTKNGFTYRAAVMRNDRDYFEYMQITYEMGKGYTVSNAIKPGEWRLNITEFIKAPSIVIDWCYRFESMARQMSYGAYAQESTESFYRVTTEARFMGSQYAFLDYPLDFDDGTPQFSEVAGITDESALQALDAIATDAGATGSQSFLVLGTDFDKPTGVVGPIIFIWAAKLIAEALRQAIGPYGPGLLIEPGASGAGTSLVPVAELATQQQTMPDGLEESLTDLGEKLDEMVRLQEETGLGMQGGEQVALETMTRQAVQDQTQTISQAAAQQRTEMATQTALQQQTNTLLEQSLNKEIQVVVNTEATTNAVNQVAGLQQVQIEEQLRESQKLSDISQHSQAMKEALQRQEQRELESPDDQWQVEVEGPELDAQGFEDALTSAGPDAAQIGQLASSIASSGGGGWSFPVPLPASTLGAKSAQPWALAEFSIRPDDQWDWVLDVIRNIAGLFIAVGFAWRTFLLVTWAVTQGGEGSKGS